MDKLKQNNDKHKIKKYNNSDNKHKDEKIVRKKDPEQLSVPSTTNIDMHNKEVKELNDELKQASLIDTNIIPNKVKKNNIHKQIKQDNNKHLQDGNLHHEDNTSMHSDISCLSRKSRRKRKKSRESKSSRLSHSSRDSKKRHRQSHSDKYKDKHKQLKNRNAEPDMRQDMRHDMMQDTKQKQKNKNDGGLYILRDIKRAIKENQRHIKRKKVKSFSRDH